MDSFKSFALLKEHCRRFIQNPKDMQALREMQDVIKSSTPSFMKIAFSSIVATFYPVFKSTSSDPASYNNSEKQVIVETLKFLFEKSSLAADQMRLSFNIYHFLLFQIYDPHVHKILDIPEEYKLSIIRCTISLMKSASSDLLTALYTKENVTKLCLMLHVVVDLSKTEQLRALRIASIECIMAIAHVLDDDDFNDVVVRDQIADMFLFFLPGIVSSLTQVALVDEKVGHKVPACAIKAWGRIVTLLMQDYNAADHRMDLAEEKTSARPRFSNENEMKDYLSKERTVQWYKETDSHLQKYFIELKRLTHHSHRIVRRELTEMCFLVTEYCLTTMPTSVGSLMEIVIILSQDECNEIATKNQSILDQLSRKLNEDALKILFENLEENFYGAINCLPRIFNSIDESEKIAALNLIIGYISLFGNHNLGRVLLSNTFLDHLMNTMIHISAMERNEVRLFEEYVLQEFELTVDLRTPWIRFRCFKEQRIKEKIEQLCGVIGRSGSFRLVSDFLLDVILYEDGRRKEAIFLINSIVLGLECNKENSQIVKNIVNTYIDDKYWNVPCRVMIDEYDYEYTVAEIQENVVQVCLLVEGLGKIGLSMKENFREYLLRTIYPVLDRAGSGHPLIRMAGLTALTNISVACGYSTITDLINDNIDYFTYHVERRLNKLEENEGVLNVLAVVLKYSRIDVLQHISHLINDVLMQSCDRFKEHNATAFLNIFKVFLQCLKRWLGIEVVVPALKSKREKDAEMEGFKVTGVDPNVDFSDEIMGRTAEEMFEEDMAKSKEELMKEIEGPETETYKKPVPPMHVQLTVAILVRSLHFLPSKDRVRKLLVLEILNNGLEIVREWEDELLPIVHQIWSPLVQRFAEFSEPLIVNYSFKLLMTLSRLSKDFIRIRTSKEALPNILKVLKDATKESYLKDKGSAYRYSQLYKLQLTILGSLGRVLADLDVIDEDFSKAMDVVYFYLSNRQPVPLQTEALKFFQTVSFYDRKLLEEKVTCWIDVELEEYKGNVDKMLEMLKGK